MDLILQLVYTFHLRKDAVWVTDKGEEYAPVTAHDFVYSWNKLIDPKSNAQYNFMLGSAGIVGGEELKDLGIKAILNAEIGFVLSYIHS